MVDSARPTECLTQSSFGTAKEDPQVVLSWLSNVNAS